MKEKGMTTINLKKFNRNKVTNIFISKKKLPNCRLSGICKWDFLLSVRI